MVCHEEDIHTHIFKALFFSGFKYKLELKITDTLQQGETYIGINYENEIGVWFSFSR